MLGFKKTKKIPESEDKRSTTEWLIDQMDFHESSHILEIGIATGGTAINMAKRLPESKIKGIDIDKTSITKATDRIKSEGLSNQIEVTTAGSEEIPFDSDLFDIAMAIDVYSLWEKPSISLFEIKRILKANAWLYIYMSDAEKLAKQSALSSLDQLTELLKHMGFADIGIKEHKQKKTVIAHCIKARNQS